VAFADALTLGAMIEACSDDAGDTSSRQNTNSLSVSALLEIGPPPPIMR